MTLTKEAKLEIVGKHGHAEGDTGSTNTGGVTTTGQENLPDTGATKGVNTATGNPPEPGTGPAQTVVDPAIVKAIRDAALAAQKAAATPPPQKTEEQKQAEAAAIARHRDAYMARVKERLQALPQG